jgi:ribosomal-protein-alanine N-acetyltransferase
MSFMRENSKSDIATRRLILEPLRLDHAELCMECLADVNLYTYVPQMPPASVDELKGRFREVLSGSGSPDEIWLNWFGRKPSAGPYVCSVQATVRKSFRMSYIAYQTFAPFRGQGFAKEACGAVIGYLSTVFGTKLIRAEIDSRNVASRKLLESLQFLQVGFKEKADRFKGTESDECVYELSVGL